MGELRDVPGKLLLSTEYEEYKSGKRNSTEKSAFPVIGLVGIAENVGKLDIICKLVGVTRKFKQE